MPKYVFEAVPYQGRPEQKAITAKSYEAALNKLYSLPWVSSATLKTTSR